MIKRLCFFAALFVCISDLAGQDAYNDVILFSPSGDTVLMPGNFFHGPDGSIFLTWTIQKRISSDSIRIISSWKLKCYNDCATAESISPDTLKKYHLVKRAHKIKIDADHQFLFTFQKSGDSLLSDIKYDKRNVFSCKMNMELTFMKKKIWSVSDFRTMYFQPGINQFEFVDMTGWKIEGEDHYLIRITTDSRIITNSSVNGSYRTNWRFI